MRLRTMVAFAVLAATAGCAAPKDLPDDAFARQLWSAMEAKQLVGAHAIVSRPYVGKQPHGAILDYLQTDVTVAGRTAPVMVKKNYGGKDVFIAKVWADPHPYLKAITVMYKREAGYDPAHQDWFYAKYAATGAVDAAGRVEDCIACHKKAPGDDYVFSFDHPK
jgi:Cytochrome P460